MKKKTLKPWHYKPLHMCVSLKRWRRSLDVLDKPCTCSVSTCTDLPTHTKALNTAELYWQGGLAFFSSGHYYCFVFFTFITISVFVNAQGKWGGGVAYFSEHTLYSQSTASWGRSVWGYYKARAYSGGGERTLYTLLWPIGLHMHVGSRCICVRAM